MNTYTTEFFATCPENGIRIKYELEIKTDKAVPVENIIEVVGRMKSGYHERIAEDLRAAFGGLQTLLAEHHGVRIKTHRSGASSTGSAWIALNSNDKPASK